MSVADLPRDFPPLRSLSTRRTNLPVQLTSFVGRERELADLEALVARHRLVTLIGTGGTGKTRLMLEAAGRLADGFADGTWLAELAPLGDPAQVASEIARALGAPEIPGQPALATCQAFLADKELLLLLDNAEHLVDAVAGIVERLLATAPRLRILTTSREALAISGEAVVHLQSLSCPVSATRRRRAARSSPSTSTRRRGPRRSVSSSTARPRSTRIHPRRGQRRVHLGDLPASRRHPARDRARGGAGVGDVARRHRPAAR